MNIRGSKLKRMLVGNESSCAILPQCILKTGNQYNLKPSQRSSIGLMEHKALILVMINHNSPIDGRIPKMAIEMIDFLFIDLPSAYNRILRMTSQITVKAVKHQVMEFPTR